MKFVKSHPTQTQKDCSRRFDYIAGFDTETTGVDPTKAWLCSWSFAYRDITDEMFLVNRIVDPGCTIPLEATAVHGISTEEARTKGMRHDEAIDEIVSCFNMWHPHPVCIFNAPYDLGIVMRFTQGFFGKIIDPLVLDRAFDPYRPGRRTLTAVAATYGVEISGAHTAAGDVVTTIKLAEAIFNRYPKLWDWSPEELQENQRTAYRTWAEHFEEYRRKTSPEFTIGKTWPV